MRRTAQIRRQYPDLIVCDIRGNLNTRLAKLDAADSKFSGIILAQAGLVRMGWMERISQILEPTDLLYAVGQGALAVECRSNDVEILSMLQRLVCYNTTCRILAERSFLKTLGGGCSAPVAVKSTFNLKQKAQGELCLEGAVWSLDGRTEIRDKITMALKEDAAKNNNNSKKRNAENEYNCNENDASSSNSNSGEPASKRFRNGNSPSTSDSNRSSPPVINEDENVENMTNTFGIKELLEKHINLAKKCPIVGHELISANINSESSIAADNNGNNLERGAGGDAEVNATTHCPLHLDVGQDVMGKCPFVNEGTKLAMAAAGKCPVTHASNKNTSHNGNDETDKSASSSNKCPFSSMHSSAGDNFAPASNTHGKCPFLQKTVKMFDYSDEEKPEPHKVNILTEEQEEKNINQLHCGIYMHDSFERFWYDHSNNMGIELAQKLIKQGALEVMKVAQAEIHSKA